MCAVLLEHPAPAVQLPLALRERPKPEPGTARLVWRFAIAACGGRVPPERTVQ